MITTLLATLPFLASSVLAAQPQYGVVEMPRFERRIAAANSTGTSLVERSTIEKRAYSGRATWYAAGLGACGGVNSASDKIVALGQVIWDTQPAPGNNPNNSPWCGKKICISYGGKSQEATIVDLCPYSGGCSASDGAALDMSQSLFEEFGSLGLGVFQMTWQVGGCGGDDSAPAVPATPVTPAVNVQANVNNNDNNDQATQDQAAQDKAAADKKAADDAAWAKQQADKKAADDAAWASQQAASSASAAAAQSSADNARYLASVSSQSAADAASSRAANRQYLASLSSASEARQDRISSQSIVSVASARSERIESISEASVASRSSVRSEFLESKSIVSVQSVKSESRSSVSAASASVAPVVNAMADVYSNLAAMFTPEATPAPSAKPSRS